MFKDLGNELIEVLLQSDTLEGKVGFAIELKNFHLLALVADGLAAAISAFQLTCAFVENTADLNVRALSATLGAEHSHTVVSMKIGELVHPLCPMKVVIVIDLALLCRVFNEIFGEVLK